MKEACKKCCRLLSVKEAYAYGRPGYYPDLAEHAWVFSPFFGQMILKRKFLVSVGHLASTPLRAEAAESGVAV